MEGKIVGGSGNGMTLKIYLLKTVKN